MRRASISVALALALMVFGAVMAAAAPVTVNTIDAIGLIDYSRKPEFKVGDYVRYRITSSSLLGMHDDYLLTVLIAGEEMWWGEKCFWVETWTEPKDKPASAVATLLSYAIFDDSLAYRTAHQQVFCRKTMGGSSEVGEGEQLMKLAGGAATRRDLLSEPGLTERMEDFGTDTVQTPMGTIAVTKKKYRTGATMTNTLGDSSVVDEDWNFNTRYASRAVPITGIAKEDLERVLQRRAWMIGRSSEAEPMRIRERATGTARLVDYGHGLASRMLPKERQRAVDDTPPATPRRRTPAPRRAR